YLAQRVERFRSAPGLEVRFNTEVSVEMLPAGQFDVVVLATGARPKGLAVEGSDRPHVLAAVALLQDPARADAARRVVVVGGGEVGCEVAHFLAYEKGKAVTVIEMLPHLMAASCTANRGYLIHYLEARGVQLWNCARLTAIGAHAVTVVRNVSPTVPSPYATWSPVIPENVVNPLARPMRIEEKEVVLPADLVVVAVGMAPDDALYQACLRARVAPAIHNIGDAFAPASILEATRMGELVGRAV
ncbi:MAG: FAD-dependent oxidoreductase, partial [Anaerolineae bacterium]|nr:FAD-dependent oxidoreductase [Anaerolineae bacterium]